MDENNVSTLDKIKDAIYKKREEALAMVPQNPELIEEINTLVNLVNIPSYIKKIKPGVAKSLFKYCGFPEEKWDDMYYKAFYETTEKETYTYINPEDIERSAR